MNPYKVLGVSENASPEEIRKAYLALVKKYHPDRYADGPLKDQANEKLKEINQAYEMLTKKGSSSGSGSYSSGGWQQQYRSSYSGAGAADFARVRTYLAQNNVSAAKALLDSIELHNAEWNYLYGLVYFRMGWYSQAKQYLSAACRMDPSNSEYANAYQSCSNAGQSYTGAYNTASTESCDMCDLCSTLMCLNCLCNLGGCR